MLAIVYKQYFKNYYRSRSFYLMFILVVIISIMMTYLTFRYHTSIPAIIGGGVYSSLSSTLQARIFNFLWAFGLSNFPVFASVFFGSPSISSEVEFNTAFHIFPLPISRYTLLFGKYLAALSVTIILISFYMGIQVLVIDHVFNIGPVIQFYYSYIMALLFVVSIMAFTFMVSSIFTKNLYAYITVFVIYFLIFNSLAMVFQIMYNFDASFLLNSAGGMVGRVYIDIDPSTLFGGGSLSPATFPEIMVAVMVMILYTVISLAVAVVMFERMEAAT